MPEAGLPQENVIPPALRNRIDEVDRMIKGETAPPPPEADGKEPVPDAAAAARDPAATPPAPPAQTPPAQEDPNQSWEQRYNSIKGRLDKTNEQFQAVQQDNQMMMERMRQMEGLIAQLQASGAEPPRDPNAAPPPPPEPLVKPEEVDEYGKELIDVVGRKAKEVISPELQKLSDDLKKLQGQVAGVAGVQRSTGIQGVYARMTEAVPDWRDLNRSDEFKAWAAQRDPFSGRIRAELMNEALTRQEPDRVIAFFKGYREAAGLPPVPPANGAAPPPGNSGSGRPQLEDFAAPGRARSAPPPASAEKPIYTHADIQLFMREKLTGKWKGREDAADAKERDIFQAQHEGRIRP